MGFVSPYSKNTKQVAVQPHRENSSMKPTLESYRIAEQIAVEEIENDSNISLKEFYSTLMNQLEIEGIPKQKISTVGQQLVIEKKEQKLKSKGMSTDNVTIGRWWFEIAKKQGCVDPHYSHPKNNLESKEKKSIHKTNQRYVDNLKRTKEICTELIKKFEETDDIEKTLDKKQLQYLNHEWDAILDIAENTYNEKTKVPLNLQNLLLIEASTASSITYAGMTFLKSNYLQYQKIGSFLTTKQIGHIQNGITRKSLPLFKPDSRDSAIFQKYYGLPCIECKSWRVYELLAEKPDGSNLGCYDCDNTFKEKTVSKCRVCQYPFYKENLIHVIQTGRCDECNGENRLPEELIEYADPDGMIRNRLT